MNVRDHYRRQQRLSRGRRQIKAGMPRSVQKFAAGHTTGVGSSGWTVVRFARKLASDDVVVVAQTAYLNTDDPGVVRIRNITKSGFECRVDGFNGTHSGRDVYWFAAVEGNYTVAEHGVKMDVWTEAACPDTNNVTGRDSGDTRRIDNAAEWVNTYTTPVILAQVTTYNSSSPQWAGVYASTGNFVQPGSGNAYVSRDRGQASTTTADEDIGIIVVEAGKVTSLFSYTSLAFGVATDSAKNMARGPFSIDTSSHGLLNVSGVVLQQLGQEQSDGSHAVVWDTALSNTQIQMAIDEETAGNADRDHDYFEHVAWMCWSPADTPQPVADLALTDNTDGVSLSAQWTDPSFEGFDHVALRWSTAGYPATVADGNDGGTYAAGLEGGSVTGLSDGVLVYVSAFAVSITGTAAAADQASETPNDTAPANVANLVLTPALGEVTLDFDIPSLTDFSLVEVRRASGATAPSTPDAGTQVYSGGTAGTSPTIVDSGPSDGEEVSYAIWVQDTGGQWSLAAVTGTTTASSPFLATAWKGDGNAYFNLKGAGSLPGHDQEITLIMRLRQASTTIRTYAHFSNTTNYYRAYQQSRNSSAMIAIVCRGSAGITRTSSNDRLVNGSDNIILFQSDGGSWRSRAHDGSEVTLGHRNSSNSPSSADIGLASGYFHLVGGPNSSYPGSTFRVWEIWRATSSMVSGDRVAIWSSNTTPGVLEDDTVLTAENHYEMANHHTSGTRVTDNKGNYDIIAANTDEANYVVEQYAA